MNPLSIIVPGIRTHLWERLYKSILPSLNGEFEIIFISPFALPEELKQYKNINHIKSLATVPVCLQIGTLACKYDTFCHAVDDSVFLPNSLESIMKNKEYYSENNAVSLTYIENTNSMIGEDKWSVRNLPEFHLPYIDRTWRTWVQPLMSKQTFCYLGGLECSFEYSNHSHHDLAFRFQKAGGSILIPNFPISVAEHMPERTGDHGPIHDAQMNDIDNFNKKWSEDRNPIIHIEQYENYNFPWKRRFNEHTPSSYEELCKNNGYKI